MNHRNFLFFLVFLISPSCAPDLGFDADSGKPVSMETFRLQKGSLPRKRVFSASTLPWEMVVLSFKTSGRLLEAPFEEGMAVRKGQLLGRLDPVDQYMARTVAKEKLRTLEADVARVEKLARQGALADAERERILGYREALVTQLSQADIQLEATILRSPMDGVIGRKMAQPGEMMDPAKPLGVLLVTDPVKIQVAVQETDLPLFVLESPVRIRIGERELEGRVFKIPATADEATRTFTVTLSVPNPPSAAVPIRVGQLARVEVDLPPISGFFVPASALETGAAGQARMIGAVSGRLRVFFVQTHEKEGDFVRVTGDFPSPLSVILGGFSLPDGQPVAIRTEWTLDTWSGRRLP